MFYAISKRRRDINVAEARGYEEGRLLGIEEGRAEGRRQARLAVLKAISDHPNDAPSDVLKAVIAELRAQSCPENRRPE